MKCFVEFYSFMKKHSTFKKENKDYTQKTWSFIPG